MRIGIIGYGAIAAIHASVLSGSPGVEVSVWGPSSVRTRAFATGHGLRPARSLGALLAGIDATVVASPSGLHERQAAASLAAGAATLVEVLACRSVAGGRRLAVLARRSARRLQGARTSRYLEPFRRLGEAVAAGAIGDVQRVTYRRELVPRVRTWPDDALWHHAQHPIDLLAGWFGDPVPVGCRLTPSSGPAREVHAVLELPGGAPVTVDVRYGAEIARSSLRVDGSTGALETDGFSALLRDGTVELGRWDPEAAYRVSVRRQDVAFLAACADGDDGGSWDATLRVATILAHLQALAERRDD